MAMVTDSRPTDDEHGSNFSEVRRCATGNQHGVTQVASQRHQRGGHELRELQHGYRRCRQIPARRVP